jgi:serine/threonine protein kinase/Leucine-rich repeat (LRR) protein
VTHLDDTVLCSTTTDDTASERRCPVCGILVPDEIERCPNDGTVISASPKSELNSRYEFLEPIGKGGMSVVYKARHRLMGNLVAIKLLQDKLTENAAHVKRFQQEAQAAGRLDHSNLIKVNDFGVLSSGYTFLVMDYADGHSLSEVIHADGHLSGERALPLFMQICDGLSHAHTKGILHRDLKPSNVIVINDPHLGERIKIVDFGIAKMTAEEGGVDAKLTATGEVFGSPYYMSPEQCSGSPVDQRSDIYSMGCLMYEVLTGRVPLAGTNLFETIHKQISEVPEPLSKYVSDATSTALSGVVDKALAKAPGDRYQNFGEMLRDLQKVGAGHTISNARRPTKAGLGWAATAAGCGALVALSVAAYIYHVGPFAPPQVVPSVAPRVEVTPPPVAPPAPPKKKVLSPREDAVRQYKTYPFTNMANMNSAGLNDRHMFLLSRNRSAITVNVENNPGITSKGIAFFANHPTLENFHLDGTSIGDDGLVALGTLPKIKYLTLGNTHITPKGFKYLAKFSSLETLWLEDLDLTNADLAKLPVFPKLGAIKFDYNTALTDAAMPYIVKAFPHINHLTVRNTGITDGAIPELLKLKNLSKLSVYGSGFTRDGAKKLLQRAGRHIEFDWKDTASKGSRPWLRSHAKELTLGEFNSHGAMTDDALKLVAADPAIRAIDVQGSVDVTSRGLMPFRDNEAMQRVNVTGTSVDNECLPVLATMPQLDTLEVSYTKVTSAGFNNFAAMKNLRTLYLGRLNLTNADLQKLPDLPKLRWLVLDRNKLIDDEGIKLVVAKCPGLYHLTLRETGITDATIDELLKLPQLKEVSLMRTRTSDGAIKRLSDRNIQVVK